MEPSREGCLAVCKGIVPPLLLKIGDINSLVNLQRPNLRFFIEVFAERWSSNLHHRSCDPVIVNNILNVN